MEETGIVENLPWEIYNNRDGLRYHVLAYLRGESEPAHCFYLQNSGEKDSPAMMIGRAIHEAALGDEDWRKRYVVGPEVDRRTKAGKAEWEFFCHVHSSAQIVTADQAAQIAGCADSIKANRAITKFIRGSKHELSIFWKDRETGLLCKGRVDCYDELTRTLFDLKTSHHRVSRRSFQKHLAEYGVHGQMAFYKAGLEALGKRVEHVVIGAVENEPPYCSAAYRLSDRLMELARRENEELVKRYAFCCSNKEWPGYPQMVQDLELPEWAMNELETKYGERKAA